MHTFYKMGQSFRWTRLLSILLLLVGPLSARAQQTFYDLSTGNYSQDFADIANFGTNFASGIGANNFRTATNVATSPVTQPTVFVTGVSGGVQKGTGNIVLLATGSGTPSNAAAFDLLLNLSTRTAATLKFDYAKITNTVNANPRKQTLKVQYSLDNGVTFTDLTGYTPPVVSNDATTEGGTITIALPAATDNQSQVVIRFFATPNGDNTGAVNRPKISIDNILVLAAPTITSFTPPSGPVSTSVTVNGTNFTGATAVTLNGAAVTYTVGGGGTTITFTVPAGATSGTIAVTTPNGTATSATSFTVTASAPTITSFTPTSGPVGTGVTITGTNFTGASAVTLNGAAVTYSIVDANTITFTVPTGATSGTIAVTTPGGTVTSTGSFTVTASAPTITSFSPTSGPVGTGVTITGTNFTGAAAVTLNGTAVTYTVTNASTITFTVPAGATSGTIAVTTPGGTATSAGSFTVTPAALTDLTVSGGTLAAPTPIAGNYNSIFITGTGVAVVVGPLTAAVKLEIQPGGILAQNCQIISGSGNFDLQAGGTLIICDAAGISPAPLPTGAILLAGTRTYSPLANYIYNNTVAQVTGLGLPSTVLAVGVQNPAGVTLSQALSLTQGLQLQAGNLNTGGFTFTLLSSAAGTAGVVNAGGEVVGATTVQRYINSSNPLGYRHYSAPVSNTTFADLNAPGFSPVFNPSYNTSATPGTVTSFPTVFGYNQDRIATVTSNYSAFDKGWFSPNGAGDPMVVGKGYTVNAPNTALIDFVGTLNNGPVPSGTLNRGADAAAGWHLLGNPYPSPLDWSTVAPAQRPGMDAAIYVFESAGQYGGSYRASVNGVGGVGGNSPQPIVVSSQGYFVRVATGQTSGQVNLDNPNRVTTFGTQPSFGRGTADTRPQVALTLQGASVADVTNVYFQAGATTGKDVEFDATKLPNSHGLNLTSLGGGEALAINGLPALGTATVLVPLNVAAPQAGSYALKADALANLAGTTVTLVDALTSTRTVLAAGTTYAFTLGTTTAAGRFSLEFRPTGALATTAAQALAAQTQLFPNPASASFRVQLPVMNSKAAVQATLLNALGQPVLRRSLSAAAGQAIDAEFDVRALAAGVYTLRLDVNGTPVTRKVVVE